MLVEDLVDEIQVRFDRAGRLLALFARRREVTGVLLGLTAGGMLAPAEAARRKRKRKRCLQDERRCGKQSGKKGGAKAGRRTVAAPPSAPA
jgi:protein-disulfide isomerase-like protein with CxxC motif